MALSSSSSSSRSCFFLRAGPVQKLFLGLFRGDIYSWFVGRSKQRKLDAKRNKKEKQALLTERFDSLRYRRSETGLVASMRLKRQAQAELEDEEFLRALKPLQRGKLLDLRQKHHESSGLRRYMYSKLVKEKQESLKKKLEGPVAAPLWNSYLGYALSLLYVAFMRCV
jgi:hypothetical protein